MTVAAFMKIWMKDNLPKVKRTYLSFRNIRKFAEDYHQYKLGEERVDIRKIFNRPIGNPITDRDLKKV